MIEKFSTEIKLFILLRYCQRNGSEKEEISLPELQFGNVRSTVFKPHFALNKSFSINTTCNHENNHLQAT